MTTRSLFQFLHVLVLALAAMAAGANAAEVRAGAAVQTRGAVVFFGDSLTAGYGLEDPDQAYPALLGERMAAEHLPFESINAGVSGETTAGGVRRVSWVLRRKVALFVIALGGNDGLRGIPVKETEKNLQTIIDAVRKQQPDAHIVLVGMQAPPSMGPEFTAAFRETFPRLAKANDLPLVPFLLEGVAGIPRLNQADGIHPTPEGQRIVADVVWTVIAPVLRKLATE